MNLTIKEIIEQHSNLRLDNAEDRKKLFDALTAEWEGTIADSYNDGYEDGYNEGQNEYE